jgi:hypothetical protein
MIRKVIFFTLLSANLHAQITFESYVRSALLSPDVQRVDEQLQYLGNSPYKLAPLQRIEFRTQNRELERRQQEVGLRFVAANPWEVRNNNNFFKAYTSSLASEREVVLKDEMLGRYQTAIQYMYYKSLAQLISYNKKLIDDQLNILQGQAGSKYFDADEFVDLQLDEMDRSVDLDEAMYSMREQWLSIEVFYGQSIPDSLPWSIADLPLPSRLIFVADSLSSLHLSSVLLDLRKQQVRVAESEYKLEKANINAGFIQTDFDNRRNIPGRNPVNISLGITLPLFNPNKGDMAQRQLDVIASKFELDETSREVQRLTSIALERLRQLAVQHERLADKLKKYQEGDMAGVMSMIEEGDPRILVRFDSNVLKLKILQLKVFRDALLSYVGYLHASDLLQRSPIINYLSEDLSTIE